MGETPTTEEIREMSKKEIRKQFPSGWMELARYETLVLALDALLEAPAPRAFTVEELAEQAGTTRRSLADRIDSLVELSIVEVTERDGERAYTLNTDSEIVDQLYELNVAVQRVRDGEPEAESSDRTESGLSADTDAFSQTRHSDTRGSRYSRPQVSQ